MGLIIAHCRNRLDLSNLLDDGLEGGVGDGQDDGYGFATVGDDGLAGMNGLPGSG